MASNAERARRWRQNNPERARESYRRWAAANPEKFRAKSRAASLKYYHAHPEKAKNARRRREGLPEPTYPPTDMCELCERPAWLELTALHLDHDHETGVFRGWLCASCNVGLGKLGDTVASLEKALAYLKRTQKVTQ